MALFDDNNDERTETATPHRREEFRKQGTVALSREVLSVLILAGVSFALYAASTGILREFGNLSQHFFRFDSIADFGKSQLLDMRWTVVRSLSWMVGPVLAVAVISGIIASVIQVGFYFSTESLALKWERLDPIKGFGRIFSAQGVIEAFKSLIKIAIASWIIWSFLKNQMPGLSTYYSKTTMEICILTFGAVGKLFATLLFSLAAMAALDYGYQRFQLEKQMKMTRREAKEEYKLREGDPLIKQRIKSIQRKIASRRMMEAVPKATVIVTNPTHLAIALQYDQGMQAPRITAKGAGFIADKIKELARFHHIPIVENKPLARNIFKTISIGQFIPRELYKAVAEVLSYVYKLKGMVRT